MRSVPKQAVRVTDPKPERWATILRRGGPFTVEEVMMAQDWNSCAVGERANWQDAVTAFSSSCSYQGADAITFLGYQFGRAVWMNDRRGARRIYRQLQRVFRGESP